MNFPPLFPKINEFHQKKFRPPPPSGVISPTLAKSGVEFSFFPEKMSDSEDEIPRYSPQLVRETYTTGRVFKNPRVEYFKEIIRKIRGKTNFHSKILNFTNLKFFPKFHLLKSHGKKSEIFAKPPAGKSTATSTPFSII